MAQGRNRFLLRNPEKPEHNQYWYSGPTIEALLAEIAGSGAAAVAFVSTPSLYFSLKDDAQRAAARLFDFDTQWEKDPGFVFYDFNHPVQLPEECRHHFDFVVVDPPFITEEVWQKYADTVRFLLADGGRVLCSTIAENADMMQRLLDLRPVPFKPLIPHLVYQYLLYANYPPAVLHSPNPEVPDD